MELTSAYAACRLVARREARNFYYGFLALPRHKSDAMCAVYAFMRRADDISDDESMTIETRREMMAAWLHSWHTGLEVADADRPVFTALHDVQQSFGIEDDLLDKLVQGTTMDLEAEPQAGVQRITVCASNRQHTLDAYQDTGTLENYCYLVASVVGLVTIRIFGFRDPEAESFAVDLGRAFQFTNILRDVKEDADRGRLYLPLDLLQRHGATPEQVLDASAGGAISSQLRSALRDLARCADVYYDSADRLIPLLDRDSRSAMRVLVGIYRALLQEIEAADFDVFARRLRVSTPKKILLFARGFLGSRSGASSQG